ncbi:unnamed protein product [Mytilus coruscus]|uniref:Tc1-like transposase DDE domain-containing protein n=1 Tax=Mytilus coruscus TaxID=42192 RepID=A0A6J8DXD2_MYTCO|nr:unnamed protein product [Mytilus coruscus]
MSTEIRTQRNYTSHVSDPHQRLRLAWCLSRRGGNLKTWRRIHWSDENWLLLYVIDGRMRVCKYKNTAHTTRNIQPTVPYGGGSLMIYMGCISHDCKLDLVTIRTNLTGNQYIREVLQPAVVHKFDNHPLAARPVFMDDNAMSHRSMAVTAYIQGKAEAKTSLPWPAMKPDLNPKEHVRDLIGHRLQAVEPPLQNLQMYVSLKKHCTRNGDS